MKNLTLFTLLFLSFAIFSNTAAQANPDSDLRDNNIRMRSNELERIKREANKNNSALQMNTGIEKKFPKIKEDYEGIQRSQEAIVKAYTAGEKINYGQIEKSAKDVTENAERLSSNLFTAETKTEKSIENDNKKEKTLKDLIVELDNAIGSFVSSKMFQNLKVVDQKVADKAQSDLAQILKISRNLSKEAGKMK